MEFTVKKADLVRELGLSQGVVEKKATIPILSNVLIEAGEGELRLLTTDLELGLRCGCPADVKAGGVETIPARRLLDYVRLLPDSPIHISFDERHWASLSCGRSRTRIAGMSNETFPELPVMPEKLARFPVSVLMRLVNRTMFSISAEETRFTLNGALLLVKPDRLIMVATDGHRLALSEEEVDFGEEQPMYRALVPKKAMVELLKLGADEDGDLPVNFSGDENHLFFEIGKRTLICRKLTGNFPDYERVLPAEHPHQVELDREELRATTERVAQFADERSHAVRVRFAAGEVTLHSSLSDRGETEENIPVVYDGPKVEVGFNAYYIADFLRAVDDEKVVFHFHDAGSAGEMRPGGEGSGVYRYVVMPMRI